MGGYNKINNKNNWKAVYSKMGLSAGPGETIDSLANALKSSYKKYLLNFHEFYRKLGGLNLTAPAGSRSTSSRPSRNERNWRERHDSGKDVTPAKTRRKKSATETETPKVKEEEKEEKKEVDEKPTATDDQEEKGNGRRNSAKKRGVKAGRKKVVAGKADTEDAVESDDGGPQAEYPADADSDTDDTTSKVPSIGKDVEVAVGDKVTVRYGKEQKELYDAKVLKVDKAKDRFFVHYNGWNTRYDEWVRRTRITAVLNDKGPATKETKPQRRPTASKPAAPPKGKEADPVKDSPVKTEQPTPVVAKRGRPPSAATVRAAQEASAKRETERTAAKAAKGTPVTQGKRGRARSDVTEEVSAVNEESQEETGGRLSREDSVGSISNHAPSEGTRRSKKEPIIDTDKDADTDEAESPRSAKDCAADEPAEKKKDDSKHHDLDREEHSRDSDTRSTKANEEPRAASQNSRSQDDDDDRLKPGKRGKRGFKEAPKEEPQPKGREAKEDRRQLDKKKPTREQVKEKEPEEESPRRKKMRRTKGEVVSETKPEVVGERPAKTKASAKIKQEEEESETQKPAEPIPAPVVEEDVKGKRKRLSATPKASRDQSLEKDTKDAEPPSKKRVKRDDDRSLRKDDKDDDTNQEVARLFDEEKSSKVQSAEKSQAPQADDGASSFLLCAEEVPLSPVHQAADDHAEEPSSNASNFASAVSASYNGDAARGPATKDATAGVGHFTPPTTPDSVRSGTISSLTPPHETHDSEAQHTHKSAANSTSNSDTENDNGSKGTTPAVRSPPQVSEDSCSQHGPNDVAAKAQQSPAASPKKRMRGRKRTLSTSEHANEKAAKNERTPIKTRGVTGRRSARAKLDVDGDRYSPTGSSLDTLAQQAAQAIALANYKPNQFFTNITVTSKHNFVTPIDENLDAEKRIQILQDRLSELRKKYIDIKSELAQLDRRRKKAKRKERTSNASSPSSARNVNLDRSTSSDLSDDAKVNGTKNGEQVTST